MQIVLLRSGLLRHLRNYMVRLGLLKRKHPPPPPPPVGRRPGKIRKAPASAGKRQGDQERITVKCWCLCNRTFLCGR